MARVRVHNLTISLDGFAAGPDQSVTQPIGAGGGSLHDWAFATRSFRSIFGIDGGTGGVDDEWAARGDAGIGATIMGRNMFGPNRGPWPDEDWRGWWGDTPPFHHPVFVLTHHPRRSFNMDGGTTFHFVTDGIEEALARALDAAAGQDVRIGGGAATVQQYLRAGLVDDMHVAIVPILLGRGARLFDDIGEVPMGYECVEFAASPAATHTRISRRTDMG